jgi:hypothetical protein
MDKYFGSDSPSWGVEEMKLENSSWHGDNYPI